jgi:hypothetical protein
LIRAAHCSLALATYRRKKYSHARYAIRASLSPF